MPILLNLLPWFLALVAFVLGAAVGKTLFYSEIKNSFLIGLISLFIVWGTILIIGITNPVIGAVIIMIAITYPIGLVIGIIFG